MRKIMWSVFVILAVASCLAFVGQAPAQQQVTEIDGDAAYFEAVTCGTTAAGFSATYVAPTVRPRTALISVRSASVKVSFHGTAASASVGHTMASGDSYAIRGYQNIKNFSCINATSGTSGYVDVTYFY